MINYIAFVPKTRLQKPVIQFMGEGQEDAFWPYYEFAIEQLMPRIAKGRLSVSAFAAEGPAEALQRVVTDYNLKLRSVTLEAIYLGDDAYEALTAPHADEQAAKDAFAKSEPIFSSKPEKASHTPENEDSDDFPYTNEEIFGAK